MSYIGQAAAMANSTARQAAMMEYSSMGLETHSPLGMYCTPQPDNILSAYHQLFSSTSHSQLL
jgi:hypothetical protein